MEIQIFVDEKEVIKFVWPNSLTWPDQFFPFVLGPQPNTKRKKAVWPRETIRTETGHTR